MSREHKYRAWDEEEGIYLNPEYFYITGEGRAFTCQQGRISITNRYQLMPTGRYTIEEYTGLKDKYGKKIYKGDIIRYISKYLEHPVDFEVVYYNGCYAQRHLDTKMEDMPEEATDAIYRYWNQLKVIGDIHENPELLKK